MNDERRTMNAVWTYYRGGNVPQGAIMPRDQVCISPCDRGFMLADGVYEVMRSYNGRLFRMEQHLARLKRSLVEIRIRFADVALIGSMAEEILRRNALQTGDATVYVQITRGACQRAHCFPSEDVPPTIYMEATRLVLRPENQEKGLAAITTPDIRWARCDIKSISLLPNVLARQAAVEQGVYEALFVRDGLLTEGTHTNVFGVRDNCVLTYPTSGDMTRIGDMTRTSDVRDRVPRLIRDRVPGFILGGITREVVMELCRTLGIAVSDSGIRESELFDLHELFLAGTTVEVTPIIRVNGRAIGDGTPGPVTRRLQAAFHDYVCEAI